MNFIAGMQILKRKNSHLQASNAKLQFEIDRLNGTEFVSHARSLIRKNTTLQEEIEKKNNILRWILTESKSKDAISKVLRLHRIQKITEQALKESKDGKAKEKE